MTQHSFGESESGLGIPMILRWTRHLNCSVMSVKFWNRHDGVSAIEGCFEALAGSGGIRGDEVSVQSVEERVEVDHVPRHVVGPFEDLGSNADQECIRGPASKDHNLCW